MWAFIQSFKASEYFIQKGISDLIIQTKTNDRFQILMPNSTAPLYSTVNPFKDKSLLLISYFSRLLLPEREENENVFLT